MCSGRCRQYVLVPGVRQQVRAGTAYGQRAVRRAAGPVVWRGRGFCGKPVAQSAGPWQPDGLPGQYVWRAAVRHFVP